MIQIGEKYLGDIYLREYFPKVPKPSSNAVLFLHGYPGSQKNYDLAEELALKGFRCFVMHYRGAWKSKGQYSLYGNLKDSEMVLEHIQSEGYKKENINLIGASWGGFMAMMLLVRHTSLRKIILLAPFINLSSHPEAFEKGVDFLASITKPSIQNYERQALASDLKRLLEEYNPLPKLSGINGSKVLIIHGANDTICPIKYSMELKSMFQTPASLVKLEDQDHFLHTRELLFEQCSKFLR